MPRRRPRRNKGAWLSDVDARTFEDGCNMSSHGQIVFYDSKVLECINRGGPGRKSKT
jgi:hypothetical protein